MKLEIILRSTLRGSELIKPLLILSRKMESSLMPLNVNAQVIQVCKTLKPILPERIRIKQDLEETIHTIRADPVQIEQIMMKISANAQDSMPDSAN